MTDLPQFCPVLVFRPQADPCGLEMPCPVHPPKPEPDDLWDVLQRDAAGGDAVLLHRFLSVMRREGYAIVSLQDIVAPAVIGAFQEGLSEGISVDPVAHSVSVDPMAMIDAINRSGLVIGKIPDIKEDLIGLPGGLLRTHARARCVGRFCCIHNPSEHSLRNAEMDWEEDNERMIRVCIHGERHPDPDHLAFIRAIHGDFYAAQQAVHECDGCCMLTPDTTLTQEAR